MNGTCSLKKRWVSHSTEAIAALLRVLNKGVWWNPNILIRDPDLKSLQNLEEFKLIVKKCEDLFESSGQNSKSKLFIYGNQKADVGYYIGFMRFLNTMKFSKHKNTIYLQKLKKLQVMHLKFICHA
jgi:hypothetical protein